MNVTNYRYSDQLLYEDLLLEKHEAFRFLYEQVYQSCMPYASKNRMQTDAAEDLLHDCLAIFVEKLRKGTYQWQAGAKVSTFFYKIFQNQCLKKCKKSASHQLHETFDEEQAAPEADHNTVGDLVFFIEQEGDDSFDDFEYEHEDYDEAERTWIFNKLQRAMDLLQEDCRLVLQLFYVEDASLQAIANIFEMTLASAAQKRFKCAKYLKEKFRLT